MKATLNFKKETDVSKKEVDGKELETTFFADNELDGSFSIYTSSSMEKDFDTREVLWVKLKFTKWEVGLLVEGLAAYMKFRAKEDYRRVRRKRTP